MAGWLGGLPGNALLGSMLEGVVIARVIAPWR